MVDNRGKGGRLAEEGGIPGMVSWSVCTSLARRPVVRAVTEVGGDQRAHGEGFSVGLKKVRKRKRKQGSAQLMLS